jgi:methylated-DNA-[protein]-cysteine S-methyltransferase
MPPLRWTTVDTPVGPVSAGCSHAGVARIRFGPPPAGGTPAHSGPSQSPAAAVRTQLAEYFGRARTAFELPLDWDSHSGARRAALELLARSVRYGQTISYGELAHRLAARDGRAASGPGAVGARAIGTIMASNPLPLIVPCHRVVGADGLGGFSGGCGVELKRWLLSFEGALPAMLDFG